MKSLPIVFVLVSVALATACGGKGKGGAAPPANDSADDPATPFDDAAVQAAIASTPGLESCGAEPSSTMGAHFAAQRDGLMTGGSGGTAVDEGFSCKALEEAGQWECQWSVFTKPSAPDPEDPCGEGGGGSGYIIIAQVGADGAVVPDKIFCNAPG